MIHIPAYLHGSAICPRLQPLDILGLGQIEIAVVHLPRDGHALPAGMHYDLFAWHRRGLGRTPREKASTDQ